MGTTLALWPGAFQTLDMLRRPTACEHPEPTSVWVFFFLGVFLALSIIVPRAPTRVAEVPTYIGIIRAAMK